MSEAIQQVASTIPEAAEFLGVSGKFLLGVLDRGELPFHDVGGERRVRHDDLLAYRRHARQARHRALDELAQQAQELGLGY